MKIVFFGTSNVALPVLEQLNKNHGILAVVTSPNAPVGRKQEFTESPVSVLSHELGIKVLKPEKVKNNPEFLAELKAFEADIFIVVSYGKLLPEELINIPKFKTLNVHFSLLPKLRGASPIQHALLEGLTETGTSIFILDKGMDTGPVLAMEKVRIEPDDNAITLGLKLSNVSAKLLGKTLFEYESGKITPVVQEEKEASYTKIISKEDGKVNWQLPATQIYDQFRAFYEWPGIWTTWNDNTIKILDCSVAENLNNLSHGQVLEDGLVSCGQNSALAVKTLQLSGKNATDINSFLNGYKDFIGSTLN